MTESPKPRLPDPSKSPRLPNSSRRSQGDANAATFTALLGIGLIVFALIAMVGLILPQVRGLILVFFAAVGFFAIHYVLWGWWLPKLTRSDDDE